MRQESYACYCKDNEIRRNSSSGGIFYMLAKEIISHGGVVYAACYRKDRVFHERIDDIKNIVYAQKSKYILSSMREIRDKIKIDLKNCRKVLFVGTPCQCASIIKQNRNNRENLFVVDFICHGVSDTLAWKAYIKALENRGLNPISYDMRDKTTGWNKFSFSLIDAEKIYRQNHYNNFYMKGFLNDVHLMKSCYRCSFATINRISDLTMGDYWGIEHIHPDIFDKNGVSLIMINSINGKLLFDKIKDELFWIKTDLSKALEYNKALSKPAEHNEKESIFWTKYELGEDYIDIINELFPNDVDCGLKEDYYTNKKMINYDVCVVPLWSNNYGNMISNYSLHSFLKKMGYSVVMLDNFDHKWIKDDVKKFNKQSYNLVSEYFPDNSFDGLNDYCESFIVASDQIWNYQYNVFSGYGRWNHLAFVDKNKRKISYASSFGKEYDSSPKTYWLSLKYLYNRFDGISVREKSGIDILKNKFGVDNAENVVDPVFICDKDELDNLAGKSNLSIANPFIFAYFLDDDVNKRDLAKNIAEFKNMDLKIVHDYNSENENTSLYDWIYYIKKCDILLTDSFHGVAMAIIMKKEFIAIKNRQQERFLFFEEFEEIKNRILSNEVNNKYKENVRDLLEEKIDFTKLEGKLHKRINKSKEWLITQLKQEKNVSSMDNDVDFSNIIDEVIKQEQSQLQQLSDLYEAREWFLQQIENKDKAIEELKNWIKELEKAKEYFEMRSKEQEKTIELLQKN